MTLNLKGKTALVTGGTKGIGEAITRRLLATGADVAICGRDSDTVQSVVAQLRADFAATPVKVDGKSADVGNESAVQALFEWLDAGLGGPDILVNNAGVGIFKDLAELSPREWESVLGTNLTGVYHCCHQALPRMRQRGGGWIINVSSLAGKNPFAGGAAYNASKFGLCGMSEALMLDHRYDGIRVSTILPGSVNTGFGKAGRADWKIAPEDVAETVAMILAMPERTLISHVEIRPSRPPRK